MPVTITINGENAPHALDELRTFAGGLSQTTPAPANAAPAETAQPDTNERPRRGRGAGKTQPAETAQQPAAEAQPNISTGGERVDPNAGKPATEEPKKLLTLDDVRNAAKPYIDKFEMAAAQVDLQFALKDAVGKTKMSDLDPNNQDELAKAIEAFTAAGSADKRYVPKAT